MASLIFNWKLVEAESRILKQSSEQREPQFYRTSQVLKDVRIFVECEWQSVYWFHQYPLSVKNQISPFATFLVGQGVFLGADMVPTLF